MQSIEEGIEKTGWGAYHKFMLSFAALNYFSNGFVTVSLPLYLPIMACDIVMDYFSMLTISMCSTLGMALGGFLLSSLADILGRKCITTFTQLIIFTCVLATGLSYGSLSIIFSQILLGGSLTANANVVKVHLAEILATANRDRCLVLLDIFYALGHICACGIGWTFTPLIFAHRERQARLFTWRILYGFSSLFSIVMACTSSLTLESPRYLIYEKKYAEALNVLKQIFAINNSKSIIYYNVNEPDLHGKIDSFNINMDVNYPNRYAGRRGYVITRRMHKALATLFSKKFFYSIFILILLKFLTSHSLYMVSMWLTKTVKYQKDCVLTSLDFLRFVESNPLNNCTNATTIVPEYYKDFMIFSSYALLGQVIFLVVIGYLEKKYITLALLLLGSSICLVLAMFENNLTIRYVLSSVFMVCYGIIESSLDILSIQMFPTAMRTSDLYTDTMPEQVDLTSGITLASILDPLRLLKDAAIKM